MRKSMRAQAGNGNRRRPWLTKGSKSAPFRVTIQPWPELPSAMSTLVLNVRLRPAALNSSAAGSAASSPTDRIRPSGNARAKRLPFQPAGRKETHTRPAHRRRRLPPTATFTRRLSRVHNGSGRRAPPMRAGARRCNRCRGHKRVAIDETQQFGVSGHWGWRQVAQQGEQGGPVVEVAAGRVPQHEGMHGS